MNHRNKLFLLITAATLNLSACGYIQSLFPDKERDYQYTTEIPALVLPSDLNTGAVAKAVEAPALLEAEPVKDQEAVKEQNEPSAETGQTQKTLEKTDSAEADGTEEKKIEQPEQKPEAPEQAAPKEQSEQEPEEKKDSKQESTPVELVRFSDGERRLRITSSTDRAWFLVSKALSRNAIEVTERDQEQKLFYVQYDPDAKKAEDGSLLDEAVFLLKGFEANEKEYLLKLVPVDDKADLAIMDKDLNPAGDEAAVKLLRLLGGTIQGN